MVQRSFGERLVNLIGFQLPIRSYRQNPVQPRREHIGELNQAHTPFGSCRAVSVALASFGQSQLSNRTSARRSKTRRCSGQELN